MVLGILEKSDDSRRILSSPKESGVQMIMNKKYIGTDFHKLIFAFSLSLPPQMVELLGPVPESLCKRGKFYSELQHFTGPSSQNDGVYCIRMLIL